MSKYKTSLDDYNEPIYIKRNGKYISYGKIWDEGNLPHGTFFIENKKYSRAIRTIKAMPDFPELESALYRLRDSICEILNENLTEWNKISCSPHEFSGILIEAIRKELIKDQKEIVKLLK